MGGSSEAWNLRTLCEDCHTRRHPGMWADPYWQHRRDQREYGRQWTAYFGSIRANILGEIARRTGLRIDESQFSSGIKQEVREAEEFYHKIFSRWDEARTLRDAKKDGRILVIGLISIGLVMLVSGLAGGIAFSGFASLGWDSAAIIGGVLLLFAFLTYFELVIAGENKAREKERETPYWQAQIQAKLENITRTLRDQSLRSKREKILQE